MKSILTMALCGLLHLGQLQGQVADQATAISPLLIGETIPDATLLDDKGQAVQLSTVLSQQPTVLVVYRGGWCPYCNQHLAALAKAEAEILALGYQIVAISPDDYQNLKPTITDNDVRYKLYADPGATLIQAMGIAFKTPEDYLKYIAKKSKGEVSEALPVPTLMVVNKKAEILFEYINPTYSTRISPELLLAVLQQLK
jgi:peroxiredoxin